MNQDPARQIFAPFLPSWLRERIGAPWLQPGTVRSGNATILYADLSGFTRLTAAFAPLPDGAERLHDTLNRCYSSLIETIGAYDGDVASIAGDALTAWWPDQADLELGRRCGQAMLAAVAALPAVATPTGPFRFALRSGVSAGLVHATLAGLPSHGLHLVLSGPAVAAAVSAESASAAGDLRLREAIRAEGPLTQARSANLAGALSWEHFLPPSFAERLRLNELIAEYRRCVPVFAAFDLPPRPEELHPLVAQVQAVVRRWGGWLNEVEVGDKGAVFVLLFGAPVARGDDASRAVGCCLELCDRGLVARAGVTLGWLFVGAVGSPQRRVYTAQGDDMNLAAHLMQLAPPGGVLVSGRVCNDVLGRYATSDPAIAFTKGHAEGVPVARIIAAPRGSEGAGFTRLTGATLPDSVVVVGRKAERRAMAEAAEAAAAGRPGLILLEGESGIGKSCLLQELFTRWVEQGRTAYSAECSSGEAPAPLSAWRPIILALCAIDEGDPPVVQQQRLSQHLATLPAELQTATPLLTRALAIGGARADAGPTLTDEDTAHLVALAASLVTARAGAAPLLIVLEDVHWADEGSLALAATLRQTGGPPRLCLALSHRPLDGPPPPPLTALRDAPGGLHIVVSRLTGDESDAMIRAQLGVAAVGSKLGQNIERHTEGQPLFIKEYLRVLRQHQLVRIEDGTADLAKTHFSVQVSNSAQGIIQARVDRLDEATRLTLKVAAVLGSTFQQRLLSTVHPARPAAEPLRDQLDTLVALQIIDLELEGPERVYRFKHGIAHEVAYRSLLFGQRRQLHAAVAHWYEECYAEEIAAGAEPAVYDQLIRHLGGAEEWALQSRYCHIAAQVAARQYAVDTALRYIEQGLVFVQAPERHFALLLLRVALHERAGNYAGQAADLAQLADLASYLDDPLRQACVGLFQLRFALVTGMAQQVVAMAPGLGRRLRQLERGAYGSARDEAALFEIACTETHGAARAAAGERASARRLLRQALGRCREAAGPEAALLTPTSLTARCLDGLGAIELDAGRPGAALRLHRQALDLAGATGDWGAEIRARVAIGHVQLAQSRCDEAFVEARAALGKSNAVGDRAGQVRALRLLAAISAARGNYVEAERDAYLAASYSAAARARALELQIWEDLAGYAAAQGLDDAADAARNEAERLRRQWWGEATPLSPRQ